MGKYTLDQRWEILKCYFQSDCCVAKTVRQLEKSFGRDNTPSAPAIRKFIRKVRETGMLIDNKYYPRVCPTRSPDVIAAVAKSVQENPNVSIRNRSQQLNISRTTLRRILHKDLGLVAYKTKSVVEIKKEEGEPIDVEDDDSEFDSDDDEDML